MTSMDDKTVLYEETVKLRSIVPAVLWLVVGMGILLSAAILWQRSGGPWVPVSSEGGGGATVTVTFVILFCIFGAYSFIGGILSFFDNSLQVEVSGTDLVLRQRGITRVSIPLREITGISSGRGRRFVLSVYRSWSLAGWIGRYKEFTSPIVPSWVEVASKKNRITVFATGHPDKIVPLLEKEIERSFKNSILEQANVSRG